MTSTCGPAARSPFYRSTDTGGLINDQTILEVRHHSCRRNVPRGWREVEMHRYVTTRDIIIPAGTEIIQTGAYTARRGNNASVLIAETRDNTSEWQMPFDEALALGLIAEA